MACLIGVQVLRGVPVLAFVLDAQKNPELRKQFIEKNAFNPERQKEIYALTMGETVVSPEEYVKALESKDAATIDKFRQQLANNPRVAQFTPDQEERIFRASEKWQNMPSEVKSMLAFVQGLSDALASPVPLSMFGLPSDNAAELGEQAASRKFIGDIGESAKSLGMMRRVLQEESPNAYDWGQLASMAVPVFGLESSVIKGLPKNVRLANEAEEALGRQAAKIIEEINDADMSRYVDYFTRPGAPGYAQAAENALIRGIGAVEGLPARGLSNAQKLRMVEDAMRRRFPKAATSAADDTGGFVKGLDEGMGDLPGPKNIGPETIDFAAEGGKAGGGRENIYVAGSAGKEGAGETLAGLPKTTKESVDMKLSTYLLNPEHPSGGSKAKWFKEALGFSKDNSDVLARQILFDPKKAVTTVRNDYGTKFSQIIPIRGTNDRIIDVEFIWIKNNDGVIRLVTSIPTKK